MFIIVTGNPVDGFEFFGPFDDEVAAAEWADKNDDGMPYWWVSYLSNPDQPTE